MSETGLFFFKFFSQFWWTMLLFGLFQSRTLRQEAGVEQIFSTYGNPDGKRKRRGGQSLNILFKDVIPQPNFLLRGPLPEGSTSFMWILPMPNKPLAYRPSGKMQT